MKVFASRPILTVPCVGVYKRMSLMSSPLLAQRVLLVLIEWLSFFFHLIAHTYTHTHIRMYIYIYLYCFNLSFLYKGKLGECQGKECHEERLF